MKNLNEARELYFAKSDISVDPFDAGWAACAKAIAENLALIPMLREVELVTALTGDPVHGNVTLSLPEWIMHVYERQAALGKDGR